MAHHTTHRRILTSQDPLLPISSSMDPTLKRHPKTASTHPIAKNPDHNFPSKPFYMSNPLSKVNPNRKFSTDTQKSTKNPFPTYVDTHLQAKAMTLSADYDGSRLSAVKPKHQQQRRTEARVDKEKVKKSSSKELVVVEKKNKVEEGVLMEKKKEMHSTVKDNKKVKDLFEGLDIKRMTVSLDGGKRRSFCGSQVEIADFLATYGAKIVSVDMPQFMQIHAVDCARKTHDSLEKFTSKTLALTLKKEFDGVYGPAWHCIVGTSFGSFVTHSVGGFLYFSMDQKLHVLLFKTTVQRAD